MPTPHPKSIRRRILEILYAAYRRDPLRMLAPEDFVQGGGLTREDLGANIHYLADRHLVELMLGYHPPLFNSARITPNGIDLVENRFEFDLRYPPELSELEHSMAALPHLLEDLLVQAELSPLDGDDRRTLLRDVQYLRDEVARPAERWRHEVIVAVLDWIGLAVDDAASVLPALGGIRRLLMDEGDVVVDKAREYARAPECDHPASSEGRP
jgi:hypothetical protein